METTENVKTREKTKKMYNVHINGSASTPLVKLARSISANISNVLSLYATDSTHQKLNILIKLSKIALYKTVSNAHFVTLVLCLCPWLMIENIIRVSEIYWINAYTVTQRVIL